MRVHQGVIGAAVIVMMMSGCDLGASGDQQQASQDPLLVFPLAYTGKTTPVTIDPADATQSDQLAESVTRGLGVSVYQLQKEEGELRKNLLALVADQININELDVSGLDKPVTSAQPLPNYAACDASKGSVNYYAHKKDGRYLVVDFDQACIIGIPSQTPENAMPLIVDGKLVVENKTHSFSANNLTIKQKGATTTYQAPFGSFAVLDTKGTASCAAISSDAGAGLSDQVANCSPFILYKCHENVCKMATGSMTVNASDHSYSMSPSAKVYDPDYGTVNYTANQLLPCEDRILAHLNSPFQSGSVNVKGATGSLQITYNGCGQPTTVVSEL